MLKFAEWLKNESIYYAGQGVNWNNVYKSVSLAQKAKNPAIAAALWADINNVLQGEGWDGRNGEQIVQCVRHRFTNYDKQQDQLLSRPKGCEKIKARLSNTKETFELVRTVINILVPHALQPAANAANTKFLNKKFYDYETESLKLHLNCPPEWFIPAA